MGNGALSFDLLLFGIPFGLLLLSGVARAFASLLDHVDDANGQQVVDEKELVDHILLTIFLGVEQFLSLVLLDALFRELVDVFDQEPLFLDHPLLSMKNAVLTPHIGGATICQYSY